jgi:hypothetical protein
MADEKLIEKIMLQVDGLLRGNLAEFIENFIELGKEVSEPKMTATLKIRLKKKKGIVYDSAIQWSKGLKRGDVSDAEIYEADQMDLFEYKMGVDNIPDGSGIPTASEAKSKAEKHFQKIADNNNAEIPLAKPRKMKDMKG